MTHFQRVRAAVWTWGPAILLIAAIFIASAQPKNPPPGGEPQDVYMSGMMPVFNGDWDVIIKKGSHMIGYAVLALLLVRALRRSNLPAREASLFAILLATSYALTDELHQAFVPGRHSSVLDIGFDYVGAASAALLVRWWLARPRNQRALPNQESTFATPQRPDTLNHA